MYIVTKLISKPNTGCSHFDNSPNFYLQLCTLDSQVISHIVQSPHHYHRLLSGAVYCTGQLLVGSMETLFVVHRRSVSYDRQPWSRAATCTPTTRRFMVSVVHTRRWKFGNYGTFYFH